MTSNTESPHPKWLPPKFTGAGLLGTIGAMAIALYTMFAKRRTDEEALEHTIEAARRDELQLYRNLREIERAEELHAAQIRMIDSELDNQLARASYYRRESEKACAEANSAAAQETYWRDRRRRESEES